MNTDTFVYTQIFNGCLNAGVRNGIASDYASRGLEIYGKRAYIGKVPKLISDTIKEAKKAARYGAK